MNYFRELYQSIAGWRQGGSTRASWEAVSRYDGLFVVASQAHKRQIVGLNDSRHGNVVTLDEVISGALRGKDRKGPIIIDHFAVVTILGQAHEIAGKLQEETAWRTVLSDGLVEIINTVAFEGRIAELGAIKTFTDIRGTVGAVRSVIRERNQLREESDAARTLATKYKTALETIMRTDHVGDEITHKAAAILTMKTVAAKVLGVDVGE